MITTLFWWTGVAVYQVKRDGLHRLKHLPKELELRL